MESDDGTMNPPVTARIRDSVLLRAYGGTFPDLARSGSADLGQTFQRLGELAAAAPGLAATAELASILVRRPPGR